MVGEDLFQYISHEIFQSFDNIMMKGHLLVAFILGTTASEMSNEVFQNAYNIDGNLYSEGDNNDWYPINIKWSEAKGAYMWQNHAGVTWTFTPIMLPSGSWDRTRLAVSNDCLYGTVGNEFAMIEWVS